MLYHLMPMLSDVVPGTNVFRYISFRTAWGVVTALVFVYLVFPSFIRWMKQRKIAQFIREDGPESHRATKVGTPTMGGLCMMVGVLVAVLLWARLDSPLTWMMLIVMIGYGAIGLVDDWRKVFYKSADGLRGRYKILGQLVIGGGVLSYGHLSGVIEPTLQLPFVKASVFYIDFAHLWVGAPEWLGWLYPAAALFIMVGASNAVNLTDGLDGLAIGPTMTVAATYGLLAYLSGHAEFAQFLDVISVDGGGELMIFAFALVGASLGFLWYNAYPASVFMGDTGSLSIGGSLALLSVLTKHELLLAVVGGIFVLEAVSVILQVGSFKLTGKRIFRMAPIHHHYEKLGWSEPKIIVRFWIISIILALVALSTLKVQ
ncbi:MAG: phospho-N-acetylmuramoyl-pentapeptide-transferase [Kiritimatiellia bacterium]|jgi:phospho-N-acetylmuramoyl-pentapeptide-transferase